jgi:galactokinase
LLVADTRAAHRHADGAYRERRESCERAAQLLGVTSLREVQDDDHDAVLDRLRELGGDDGELLVRRVRHILTENARVLSVVARLEAGDVAQIGPDLTASHTSMREDFEITVDEVNVAVEAALSAGALGARMTGGGFGGCVIALTPVDAVEAVRSAVLAAFDGHGFTAPLFFTATPSEGAHPVRS